MEYFPLFVRLAGRRVLIVGGGEVAARKVRLLRRAGALIEVVAPALCAELDEANRAGQLQWHARAYRDSDLTAHHALVVAATNAADENRRVASAAHARGVFVNVVDDPEPSTAITPAIVDRSPLLIAISSAGHAPVFIRRLRAQLEAELPSRLGELLNWSGRWRRRIRTAVPDTRARLRLWERIFDGPVATQVLNGAHDIAEQLLQAEISAAGRNPVPGEVWLVGAGPGDPDLLTLKALRRMQQADVVVHDRLLGPGILDLVRRDAERIDAGKRRDRHTLPQEDINALLVRLAREGKRVLRLKGGDPFVFGRGGEELGELMAAGVPFEVIPGITAASGAAACAGIPLTHRDHAQACIFVTGHPRKDGSLQLPWTALAQPHQTVVIYMGLTRAAEICAQLQRAGLDAGHPVAMVENATQPGQHTVVSTLAQLPAVLRDNPPQGPGLLILGGVVTLREQLRWYAEQG